MREGFHEELDELLALTRRDKDWIARLEARERQETGINSLKVRYNKVFGYYLEVSKANLPLVPEHFIRKQTLVNAERFITAELKEYESRLLGAEEARKQLEMKLFKELRQQIGREAGRLQKVAEALADLQDVRPRCRPRPPASINIIDRTSRRTVVLRSFRTSPGH